MLVFAAGACAPGSSFPTTDQTALSAAADVRCETVGHITFLRACEEDRDSDEFWKGCLDLFVTAADGTAKERIAELTAWTALSPDGTRVAFNRPASNGDWELFVADVEGAHPTRIAPHRRSVYPAWSPAGPTLAFSNNLSDSRRAQPVDATNRPWWPALDNCHARRLGHPIEEKDLMLNTIGRKLPMLLIALATLMPSLVGTPIQAQEAPPPRPTGLEVTGVGYDSVTLTRDDPVDSSITHYQTFRRDPDTQEVGDFGLINPNTGSTDTDYTDTTVKPEKSYIYRVKAVNRHGASEWSSFAQADTPAAPEPDATPETTTQAVTDGIVYDYADVGDGHFAALDIAALAADGILAGTDCQAGKFCPDAAIQRWVFAVWMVRVLDGADPEITSSRFDDIPGQPWWEGHVERLAEFGVTVGCDVNPVRYCPTDTVTRAEMAAFLDRAFDLPEAPDAGFIDTLGVFSKTSIDRLYESGITRGCSDIPLRFCPGEGLTRAQMAAFLQRGRPTPVVVALEDGFGTDDRFENTPPSSISNIVVPVHYCGAPGTFTESRLKDEIDKLNPNIATFFQKESNGESTMTFEVGDIFTPTEAMNQTTWAHETISKWSDAARDDNPCYSTVFGDSTNGTTIASRRNVALILAGVELGGTTAGFGPPGGRLFDNVEPYVIVQPSTAYGAQYGSEAWFTLVAHEIGHAAYSLCHAFSGFPSCVMQQASDEDVSTECTTGPTNNRVADPDCGGDDRLKELANSIMSYSDYGSHDKLSISYVACEQKNWLGWHDKTCGIPAAPPAPRIEVDDSQITVRWTSPNDDGWSPITGYYIRMTRSDTDGSTMHGPFTGNRHTVTGLTNGERYTVEIRARNTQGDGAWSGPSHGVPGVQQLPPDPPSVNAVVRGSTIEASWSADDNGSRIGRWEIGGTAGEVSASTTSYRWADLEPGTYHVRVRAHNAAGWGDWGTSNTVIVGGPDEPTLSVSRGGPGVAGSCTSASGCEWVHGSGSGWTPGAQFWIKCGDFVDTSRNIPVVYADRYVDSNGNLSWGNRICLSNSSHTVEVWTNSDDAVRAVIPAPDRTSDGAIPDRPSVRGNGERHHRRGELVCQRQWLRDRQVGNRRRRRSRRLNDEPSLA